MSSGSKQLSIVIQTYNEERNIQACIENARRVTESILLIDTESTDSTVEKAKSLGVPVQSFPYSRYVEPARAFGIQAALTEWVFLLDADERFEPELIQEIRSVVDHPEHTHYTVPRKELFAGKVWLKHGGWWPNKLIRLIHKPSFLDWPQAIHSTPQIKGSQGELHHSLLHFSKNDYDTIVKKTTLFEDVESQLLFEANKNVSTPIFFRKFFGELFRRLIQKQGYKDGSIGIIESLYQAFSKTITWLYVYEKKNNRSL